MIDDERCKGVMKRFRKRRRERKATKVGSLGFEAFQNSRQRRRSNHDSDGDDNDNDFMTNSLSTSSRHRSRILFSQQQPQRKQRQNHVAWGENLARRRAFTNNSDNKSESDSTTNNTRTILPEIIHRKPESIHTFSCYSRCIFLDSYDKVIGVDNCGTLDVIRLADIRSSNAEIPSSTKVRRGSLSTTHEKIATEFEFGANVRQQQFSNVHVQALNGGSTVAFGMGNESLYLLDLEYGEERRINCCSNGNGNNNNNGVLTPISLSSSFFRAYRTQHPQRKYYRDRRNPSLSIYELTRHANNNDAIYDIHANDYNNNYSYNYNNNGTNGNGNGNGNISELHKIDYNAGRERVLSPVRFIPGLCPPHDARWDVLEVHPGSNGMNSLMHVAHVDSDYDAFWMQILDGRTNNVTTTVLIDGSTRDRPGTGEEHITAVSMVTDICMATSHIYCGDFGLTPAGDFFDRDLPYVGHSGMSSCIKLWDIRMVRKKNSRNSNTNSRSMSPTPVDIIAIPPSPFFRHANIEVAEPVARVDTQLTSGKGALAFSRTTFADGNCAFDDNNIVGNKSSLVGSDYIITNLSANTRDPSCGSNNNGSTRGGSLMVTAQSRTKSTRIEHCLLNLSTFQMTRKVTQTNSTLGCQPIHAVASSRNFLATCSNRSNINNPSGNNDVSAGCRSAGASTGIFIYDMNEEPPNTSSTSFFGSGSSHDDTKSLLTNQYYSPHRQQREDPTWSFRMDASLTDRYGMETELSCIAMNANGTSLLGGSTDGDLFVWRGI